MISEPFDVLAVPFPFMDGPGRKRRPAVVLSHRDFNGEGHTVLCLITTKGHSPWPGDTEIKDFKAAGLHLPCLARLKVFTLDNRVLIKKIGRFSPDDARRFSHAFSLSL